MPWKSAVMRVRAAALRRQTAARAISRFAMTEQAKRKVKAPTSWANLMVAVNRTLAPLENMMRVTKMKKLFHMSVRMTKPTTLFNTPKIALAASFEFNSVAQTRAS